MAEVDRLEINISASSEQAAKSIERLTGALETLKKGLSSGLGSKRFDALSKSLRELGDTAKNMENSIGALAKAANAVQRLTGIKSVKIPKSIGDGIRNIGLAAEMVTPEAVDNLDRMTRSLQRLQNVDLKGAGGALRQAAKEIKTGGAKESATEEVKSQTRSLGVILGRLRERVKINVDAKTLERVKNAAKSAWGHLKNLGRKVKLRIEAATIEKLKQRLRGIETILKSLGRVAFYRAIRAAIKAITQAFSEGLKNAYLFSKGLSDAIDGRIATALDNLTTKSLTMKNQLGAAFGSLITALAPIINALISLITSLATAITQLFAAFSGGTFLKAKDTAAEFADDMKKGGGAAKEWKNQILGFDEINRLEDSSKSGGGSGSATPDPSSMFEVAPVNEAVKNFVDKLKAAVLNGRWGEVGTLIGDKINEAVKNIQWEEIGRKIGYYFNGAIRSFYRLLSTINFVEIGKSVGSLINRALEQIDFETLGRTLIRKLTAAWDFFMGLLGTIDWGLVGTKIGDFIRGAITEAKDWLESKDWEQVGNNIRDSLVEFIKGLKTDETRDALSEFIGASLEALAGLVKGLVPDSIGENIKGGIIDSIKKADFAAVHNVLMYQLDKAVFGEKLANWWWKKGDYAGEEIVRGMIYGTDSKAVELEAAMQRSVETPVGKSFANLQEKFAKWSVDMQSYLDDGKLSWQDFAAVVAQKIGGVIARIQMFIGWVASAIGWFKGLLSLINGAANSNAAKIQADGSIYLQGFASGGYPNEGQLFVAREAGPELVGTMGGHTAVANNSDIVDGIKAGVFEAVSAAMGGNGSGQPIRVYLDGREIARTTTKYQNQMARAGAY